MDPSEAFEADEAAAVELDALERARQLANYRMTFAARSGTPPGDTWEAAGTGVEGGAPPSSPGDGARAARGSGPATTTANAYAAHRAAMAVMRRTSGVEGGVPPRVRRASIGSSDSVGSLPRRPPGAPGSPDRSRSAGGEAGAASPAGLGLLPPRGGLPFSVALPSPVTGPLGGMPEDGPAMIHLDSLPFMRGDEMAAPLYTAGGGRALSAATSGGSVAAGLRLSMHPPHAGEGFTSEAPTANSAFTAGGGGDSVPAPLTSLLPAASTDTVETVPGKVAGLTRAPQQGAVAEAAATAAASATRPSGGVAFPADTPLAAEGEEEEEEQDWLPVELEEAFQRVVITGHEHFSEEAKTVCREIMAVLRLRGKHHYNRPDAYWGSWRPSEFTPDKLSVPPVGPKLSREATVMTSDTGAVLDMLSGGAAAGAGARTPSLFHRRRPELPFKVFGEKEVPPPAPVRFVYVESDGVMTAHAVTPPPSPVPGRPSAGAGADPGQVDLLPQGHAVTEAQGTALGVPTGARLFGVLPLGHETLAPAQFAPPPFAEFQADYQQVQRLTHWAPAKTFCYRRLKLLEARFKLHQTLNGEVESAEGKAVPHRDFYNVRKVDTHVHHSACMTQKHLLRFIKHKLKKHAGDVVKERDGVPVTLAQVFQELNLTAYDLSIDTLDMHADNTFQRFDRFNLKYSPIGQSLLREIFLKTDNHIGGRYLAEITRQVFDDLESSKYQLAEYRLSVYGRRPAEWGKLARWVVRHKLASRNVRWMIQIPRLYELYKKQGLVVCFQDMLDNIFLPLWEVSVNPCVDPELHQFLSLVVGIDMVDDESKQETARDAAVPPPSEWTFKHPPPYYYWVYYINANLTTLNHFRASRGLTVFSFRPHAGEAGEVDHLAATFLTAEGVNHGITMRKHMTLQYLYYLSQIGLAMSPLSNNKLFVDYHSNPFFTYFKRGLNVSLSTDDPALFHYTREPLVEEYCVAAQVWKLNSVDMCEIARNSVLQSGFEHPWRAYWIGPHYAVPGPRGSDIHLTNVPNIRLQYRFEALIHEHGVVQEGSGRRLPPLRALGAPGGDGEAPPAATAPVAPPILAAPSVGSLPPAVLDAPPPGTA